MQAIQDLMRKKWVLGLAVGLVIIGIAGLKLANSSGHDLQIPLAEVLKGDLNMALTEVGELKATRSATISAPNDRLITYLAPEGSFAKKGDLLVQLEAEKYKIAIDESKAALNVAIAQEKKAESDLQSQQYKEDGTKKQYESLLGLKEKGFAMASEVEDARLVWMELKAKTGSFVAAVEEAKSNVEHAKSGINQMENKLATNAVFAPQAGLVVYADVGKAEDGKKVEIGMTPFQGQPLMYLPDISTMQVETEINEMDVEKLKVGQVVQITLDAVKDATFKGRVSTIGSLAEQKVSKASGHRTGVKVFDVTIDVLDADPRLRPGLSANASILIDSFKDVAYAPVEAIFNEDGKTVAYVQRGRKARPVSVEIGMSNDKFVIIRSGLRPGDKVYLGQPG